MSNINPESIGIHALGDDLNFPLRNQLGIIKAELEALEGGGNKSQAFWFANVGAGVAGDSAWHVLPASGGGVTGDQSVAVSEGNRLRLSVEAVVQVKLWCEFAAAGTGAEEVGIQLDSTTLGQGVAIRGQQQLPPDTTSMLVAYDGWLAAGTAIAAVARSSVAATINAASYVTVIVTPVPT